MAKMIRVELNSGGIDALLKSAEVQADLERRAQAIADAAGEGMAVQVMVGRTRARASVRTDTFEARRAEAEDKALTSALDAGRE